MPGEARFYRSRIVSRERLTYGHAQAILAGHERASDELTEALGLAEEVTAALRKRRYGRGALRIETGEVTFAFDGEGGERAWIETEPLAHMLVEELMIAANEAVAELLAGRDREAVYRVHEQPDPQSVELLLAKLADLEVPTPPAPDSLRPADAAKLAARVATVMRYVEQTGRGREAYPPLVLRALKQALLPAQPRALGPRQPRVLPLHVADPPLSRSPATGPSCASSACSTWSSRTTSPRSPSGRLCASATPPGRVPGRRALPRVAPRAALRGRLGDELRGRDRRRDRLGHLRALRRRLRGLRAARRLSGDYFELNPLGTALVGRRGGFSYRLGDAIEFRVADVQRWEGKVELAPA